VSFHGGGELSSTSPTSTEENKGLWASRLRIRNAKRKFLADSWVKLEGADEYSDIENEEVSFEDVYDEDKDCTPQSSSSSSSLPMSILPDSRPMDMFNDEDTTAIELHASKREAFEKFVGTLPSIRPPEHGSTGRIAKAVDMGEADDVVVRYNQMVEKCLLTAKRPCSMAGLAAAVPTS